MKALLRLELRIIWWASLLVSGITSGFMIFRPSAFGFDWQRNVTDFDSIASLGSDFVFSLGVILCVTGLLIGLVLRLRDHEIGLNHHLLHRPVPVWKIFLAKACAGLICLGIIASPFLIVSAISFFRAWNAGLPFDLLFLLPLVPALCVGYFTLFSALIFGSVIHAQMPMRQKVLTLLITLAFVVPMVIINFGLLTHQGQNADMGYFALFFVCSGPIALGLVSVLAWGLFAKASLSARPGLWVTVPLAGMGLMLGVIVGLMTGYGEPRNGEGKDNSGFWKFEIHPTYELAFGVDGNVYDYGWSEFRWTAQNPLGRNTVWVKEPSSCTGWIGLPTVETPLPNSNVGTVRFLYPQEGVRRRGTFRFLTNFIDRYCVVHPQSASDSAILIADDVNTVRVITPDNPKVFPISFPDENNLTVLNRLKDRKQYLFMTDRSVRTLDEHFRPNIVYFTAQSDERLLDCQPGYNTGSIVTTTRRIYLFDETWHLQTMLALPHPLPLNTSKGQGRLTLHAFSNAKARFGIVFLSLKEGSYFFRTFDTQGEILLDKIIAGKGREYDACFTPAIYEVAWSWKHTWKHGLSGLSFPLLFFDTYDGSWIPEMHWRYFVSPWHILGSILFAGTLVSFGLILWGRLLHGLSWRCLGLWCLAAYLLPLGALVAFLAVHGLWRSRTRCPLCRRRRWIDAPVCQYCGKVYPPPARSGLELLTTEKS